MVGRLGSGETMPGKRDPTWTVRYLLTMSPASKAIVLAHGDLAGSWPIHVRSRSTGRIMTLEERTRFWLDSRGKDRPVWKPDRHPPDPKQIRLDPDLAHQPSLAYVPYLVTGDFYYLEEAYFWADYGNSCAYSARAAVICGIDAGFPRAREALEWLDAHLPGHRQVMAANPVWAILPRDRR